MTGKHYNWHRRWVIDLAACTATHDSGLIFAFRQDGAGEWSGHLVNLDAWQTEQLKRMPFPDLVKHARRLAKEAGDAYLWQLKKRH